MIEDYGFRVWRLEGSEVQIPLITPIILPYIILLDPF